MTTDTETWPGSADGAPLSVRVLIVEDDPLDAELILDLLREDGIEVLPQVVADAGGYRDALRNFGPDIVLCDLSLPGFSGQQALALLRQHDSRTPFVFVSGTIGETAAIEALRGGATDYILKTAMARLPTAVRRALTEAAERRARDAAEMELVKAQRFETLAILAGSLSHDLRNILQPVMMASQLIDAKVKDPEITRLCAMVRDCCDQGLELVTAMLGLARGGQPSQSNRLRIAALIEAVTILLRPSLPRNVTLSVGAFDPQLEIPGNSNELQQCLLNLAMNAVQSMAGGGRVELAVEPVELDEAFFHDGEPRSGSGYVRISVIDDGHGMDAATLAKLFTPFFTTKETGNGLGLVSCRRLVENHRGVIRVSSEVARGSRFDIYLPLRLEEPPASGDIEADEPFNGHGETVLVVSGDTAAARDVVDILDLYGYVPQRADTLDAALAGAAGSGAPVQAVIVDRDLVAGRDGALRGLGEAFAGRPLILLGSTGRDAVAVEKDGVAAHLSKPVTAPVLLQVLRDTLAEGRH
jgi:signal transduction histidine kinase